MAEFEKPPPLEIKCTSTDCENDLHCFKAHRKMAPAARGVPAEFVARTLSIGCEFTAAM
jgi:hypothetical protein